MIRPSWTACAGGRRQARAAIDQGVPEVRPDDDGRPDRRVDHGTPQGGILSPLLANIALSILDEKFARDWDAMGTASERHTRRRHGLGTWRLIRDDDFVVMVSGSRAHAAG